MVPCDPTNPVQAQQDSGPGPGEATTDTTSVHMAAADGGLTGIVP